MVLYAVIMFAVAILLMGIGIEIYKGKTELIHDYHRTKVTDKKGYGKAFGKMMVTMGLGTALSGAVALLGKTDTVAMLAVAILLLSLGIGLAGIVAVQKKYNKGIF